MGMFASSKMADYFKTQALLEGKVEFGAMFGNEAASTCPAQEVSVNCMAPSASSFTRRRHSAKPRAAAGTNRAKTTTLLASPATHAHGTPSGLSTTSSPSCHHSRNPSVAAAHSRLVSNPRDARPSTTSQPHQLPLWRLQLALQLSTTPPQLTSKPQSTTPSTASGKRPHAPSHAVVVSSPSTATASRAVTHSVTSASSNTTTHATNTLASTVSHWDHLATSLAANK